MAPEVIFSKSQAPISSFSVLLSKDAGNSSSRARQARQGADDTMQRLDDVRATEGKIPYSFAALADGLDGGQFPDVAFGRRHLELHFRPTLS